MSYFPLESLESIRFASPVIVNYVTISLSRTSIPYITIWPAVQVRTGVCVSQPPYSLPTGQYLNTCQLTNSTNLQDAFPVLKDVSYLWLPIHTTSSLQKSRSASSCFIHACGADPASPVITITSPSFTYMLACQITNGCRARTSLDYK